VLYTFTLFCTEDGEEVVLVVAGAGAGAGVDEVGGGVS
jgi:hypothetical protein